MRIYLDNAASTPLDTEVLESMMPFMKENFGNPNSLHTHGRIVRSAIENSRRKIADLLNTSPSEIFFTSGGTESDNMALLQTIETYKISHILSSKIEHHAVLHTIESLHKNRNIDVSYIDLDKKGHINLETLETFLIHHTGNALVSLMHANNEIGNITDIEMVGKLCKKYKVFFHSDTVQTMGHYPHNLKKLPIDFIVGSGHKFHGPKGIGFIYINNTNTIAPFIQGGSQERNMRGGTENVTGIVGIAKALEIAYSQMNEHEKNIKHVKQYMIRKLQETFPKILFNGDSDSLEKSLYTILNVSFPEHEDNDMLLFHLDIEKISASGGSACTSGSLKGSHVLEILQVNPKRGNIRFSFSKYTTIQDIDFTIEKLLKIFSKKKYN